jgi:hypothetical protein
MAGHHPAGVKIRNPWNGRQVLFRASEHFIRCVGFGGIGPEDHNVRKHQQPMMNFSRRRNPRIDQYRRESWSRRDTVKVAQPFNAGLACVKQGRPARSTKPRRRAYSDVFDRP